MKPRAQVEHATVLGAIVAQGENHHHKSEPAAASIRTTSLEHDRADEARCVAEYRTKLPPIKDADLPDEFRWRARNSDVPHLLFGVHIAIDPQGVLDRAKELGVIPEEEKHCPSMRKCVTAIMTKVYKELAVLGPGLLVLGPMPKVDEGDTLGIVYLFSNDDRKKLDNAITIAAWILSSKRSSRYGDWKTSTIFRQNGTFTGQFMVSGITILNPSTR